MSSEFSLKEKPEGLPEPTQELQRLAAEMQALESCSHIALTQVTLDGKWRKISDSFCELLGYRREELQGHSYWEITHPDDIPRESAALERLLRGEESSLQLEKRYVRSDGTTVWVTLSRSLVRTPDGEPLYFQSVQRDISAEKRVEEERAVFSSLSVELSACESYERAALAVRDATQRLWKWDAFLLSARQSTVGDFRVIVCIDTYDGEQRMCYWGSHSRELLDALSSGPLLINRDSDSPPPPISLECFGSGRRSASLLFAPIYHRGEMSGIVSLQSYTPNFFTPEIAAGLERLTEVVGPALERIRAEDSARKRDQLYRDALTIAGAVPYQLNRQKDRFDFIGEGIEQVTGYSAEEFTPALRRQLVEEVIPRGEGEGLSHEEAMQAAETQAIQWHADARIRHRNGETRWVSDTSIPLVDEQGTVWGYLGILYDITERKRAEEEAQRRELRDSLTGAASRTLLLNHLEKALHRAQRRREYLFAVVFMGIDRFGIINESLGHEGGDSVLRITAQRLQAVLRPGDIVARFSGDEFVLLLDDLHETDDVVRVLEKVSASVSAPIHIKDHELSVTASFGIVTSASSYTAAGDALRDANSALRRAKKSGRGRYEFFDTAVHKSVVEGLELENDLRRAVQAGELKLFYQPIVSLLNGRITGFEALLRWEHPVRGWISPVEFIPLAEESDLIIPIGKWVLSEAASQLSTWQNQFPGVKPLTVSINLSLQQFVPGDLVAHVVSVVQDAVVAPESFRLEITESVLMQNQDQIVRQLDRLREFHFHLDLDDFGTGYSSLAYLHRFPIDALKIDRSFVASLVPGSREQEIVRSIVALARSLKMDITAEGVETEEQRKLLQELGCTSAQGYLFSRPVDAARATELLKELS